METEKLNAIWVFIQFLRLDLCKGCSCDANEKMYACLELEIGC